MADTGIPAAQLLRLFELWANMSDTQRAAYAEALLRNLNRTASRPQPRAREDQVWNAWPYGLE